MRRLALFDCDGTLVDSQANICLAMEQAFRDTGLVAPTRAAIRHIVGLSLAEAMQALLPQGDDTLHVRLVAHYRQAFFTQRADGTMADEPLFDGIAEAIDRLSAAGWLLGVATGKSDRGLAHVLRMHGLTDRFVTLQTADRHPSKPHPSMVMAAIAQAGVSPQDTVMIGDTSFDMVMARAAGVRALGVAWGYHPQDELIAAGAHAVAQSPGELDLYLETA